MWVSCRREYRGIFGLGTNSRDETGWCIQVQSLGGCLHMHVQEWSEVRMVAVLLGGAILRRSFEDHNSLSAQTVGPHGIKSQNIDVVRPLVTVQSWHPTRPSVLCFI